jgi:hypothetical protein
MSSKFEKYQKYEKYLVPAILLCVIIVYTILVFLSDGTHGGADDIGHYRRSRYAFRFPEFFLYHWGKPFFTAISSPFAQFGFNGIRIFNVLCGTATAYFTYRTASLLKFSMPVLGIFLLLSSPLYTVLMLSGMTEILASLVLVLTIFLFFKQKYIWSAVLLSFMPFIRTEAISILPLFMIALAWQKQWKALPFLFFGFVFYSIVGSFYYDDLFWVINNMPYTGGAKDIYGSGELFHYVKESKYIFGIPTVILASLGLIAWALRPLSLPGEERKEVRKGWLMEMLVVYLPFMVYLSAHSYIWWKGMGNSVGMIRVIIAVLPSAVLLGVLGWSRLLEIIPVSKIYKSGITVILSIFLLIIPFKVYTIPVPLVGTQRIVKMASDWYLDSDYAGTRFYYYNPFFTHFMKLDPYDDAISHQFVHNRDHPEEKIAEGEIVIWDAHFSPNEGRLPLENLMDNEYFRLIHLTRDKEPFTVLGGYLYEIYFFQRIGSDDGEDNHEIYQKMLDEILSTEY